jgi:hypothetical protein
MGKLTPDCLRRLENRLRWRAAVGLKVPPPLNGPPPPDWNRPA